MKNILFFLLFACTMANAQVITFADPNFKNAILNSRFPELIDTNEDGEIQLEEAEAATMLDVSDFDVPSMPEIQYFTALKSLHCSNNNLTVLDLSQLELLIELECSQNALTSLLLNHTVRDYIGIRCHDNLLTTLDLHDLKIETIHCYNNLLTNVNLSGITAMYEGDFSNNQLTVLAFPEYPILSGDLLRLNNNPLTSFTVRHASLINFMCSNTAITTLDVSNSTFNRTGVYLSNNPNLNYINIKNGGLDVCDPTDSSCSRSWEIVDCPALQFVCVDDFEEVQAFQERVSNIPVCSPYCSFAAGGSYNTISGQVRFDSANDGCENDPFQPNIKLTLNDGTDQSATITTTDNSYNFYTLAGNFTVSAGIENPDFFTITPQTATVNFPDSNNNISTQNFCITANGNHKDLEIVLVPIVVARPGFDATYKIVYKNKGNQIMDGTLIFAYNQSLMEFVSSLPLLSSLEPGLLDYNFSNLLPFESREITIITNINTPTDNIPVNIDDVLTFTATISGLEDDTPEDNTFVLNQVVIGSYDPNDITCLQGDVVAPDHIGKYLHYNINFENTGTADAENIVVRDSINPAQFDIRSLQILNSSHPVNVKVKGDVIEFIFEGINLRPSRNYPIGGHGNVLFKIQSKPELNLGDFVENMANIYFDYNAPIDTNEAKTTFELLNKQVFEKDKSIKVSPNPAKDFIKIHSQNTIKAIELYDVQGRVLQTSIENKREANLDLSNQSNGIYFLKITTDKGSKVEK